MEEKYLFEGFEFTFKELHVIENIREKQYTIQNFLMFFEFSRINELIQANILGCVGKNEKGHELYAFIFFKECMAVSLNLLLLKIAIEIQFGK